MRNCAIDLHAISSKIFSFFNSVKMHSGEGCTEHEFGRETTVMADQGWLNKFGLMERSMRTWNALGNDMEVRRKGHETRQWHENKQSGLCCYMHKKTVLIRQKQQILYNIVQLLLISIAKIPFLIPQFFSISVIQLFSEKHIYVLSNLCLLFLLRFLKWTDNFNFN